MSVQLYSRLSKRQRTAMLGNKWAFIKNNKLYICELLLKMYGLVPINKRGVEFYREATKVVKY